MRLKEVLKNVRSVKRTVNLTICKKPWHHLTQVTQEVGPVVFSKSVHWEIVSIRTSLNVNFSVSIIASVKIQTLLYMLYHALFICASERMSVTVKMEIAGKRSFAKSRLQITFCLDHFEIIFPFSLKMAALWKHTCAHAQIHGRARTHTLSGTQQHKDKNRKKQPPSTYRKVSRKPGQRQRSAKCWWRWSCDDGEMAGDVPRPSGAWRAPRHSEASPAQVCSDGCHAPGLSKASSTTACRDGCRGHTQFCR